MGRLKRNYKVGEFVKVVNKKIYYDIDGRSKYQVIEVDSHDMSLKAKNGDIFSAYFQDVRPWSVSKVKVTPVVFKKVRAKLPTKPKKPTPTTDTMVSIKRVQKALATAANAELRLNEYRKVVSDYVSERNDLQARLQTKLDQLVA